MIRAQGYTPAIIYVEAGANLTRHMAVRLTLGAIAMPTDPAADTRAVGFAMQDAEAGEYVPIQTDGVLYDWAGSAILIPGREYYQSANGNISPAVYGEPWPVGVAINATTFQIRIGAGGGAAGGTAYSTYDEYIYLLREDVDNKYISLGLPFYDPTECLAVVLGGGSIHLIPEIDYVLEKSDPSSFVYDRVSWEGLSESILQRTLPNDIITLTRFGTGAEVSETEIVFLSNGLVVAESPATLTLLNNGIQVGTDSALKTKQFSD